MFIWVSRYLMVSRYLFVYICIAHHFGFGPTLMVLPCQVRSNFGTGDGQTWGNASVFHEIIVYHDITGMIGDATDNGG